MQRSRLALCAVAVLLVLSGCALPGSPDRFDTSRERGYVGEYAHDDVFAFDGSEALTERELEAVKYRSMARIEVIREKKFEHDVELEVISREEFRERRGDSGPASSFTNELWRGTFIVDEETDTNAAMDDFYGGAVLGYYSNDRIVIVADDSDEIRIDRRTLIHELVHALQDQHYGIERDGETADERRAELGLLEGEADYVAHLYEQRCDDEWQCLTEYDRRPVDTRGSAEAFNLGLFLSIYAPYSEGPTFVERLHERGGWDAVDEAHDDRPVSTSQLIHPDRYPDDRPVAVDVPDRSSDEWAPITQDGETHTETVGEATLFASLQHNGVVDRPILDGGSDLSPYNYSHPATDGWAGDTFTAYHDTDDRDRTGHVWTLAWESEEDAEEFADAYRSLLWNNDAEPVLTESDTYTIATDESFTGAYRVTVEGDTVTIVGAPTVAALEEIHASETVDDGTSGFDVSPSIGPEAPSPAGQSDSTPAAPVDG